MTGALDLLGELIRFRTVGGGEGAAARHCAALAEEAGFGTELLAWAPGREQLVARTGGGDGPPLTFTGHLDTVPAEPGDWSVDPYAGERDGEKVVGRGASDMKSGVAAALAAALAHAREPHACRGVQIVLTAGEETGCTGLVGLDTPARDAIARGGPLVVAEPTANALVLGHKGAHWMRLRATGRAAHGSAPELGDNAAVRLARAAVALHDHAGWPRHDRFGPVTANVGVLRGGVAPNVVPDSAELLLDVRTVPGVDSARLRAQVGLLAGERVDVADHVVLPPLDTGADDPFVGMVRAALQASGLPDDVAPPARFFTDASVLAGLLGDDAAAPTVVLGPGEPDQCHVVDEYCLAGRVEQAVTVYGELLDRWCRP
ncbi:M20 family metallopeptidase [Pseudonocardia kunmingensis]|uniref:Succinyl-diaminopimelate desuccinylase n=1 Tax=Pseudonocardia kunmingensis TaxID=630975 RepID=A0A543D3N5_9PSEU|nr:M20/M25/M40 family metallo-hydrolase [Pseudonocardia kunmingensis]TQM03949.1 succinyl-diaminopimelate desuccinylase [Pseudonocardia kunmingensis]